MPQEQLVDELFKEIDKYTATKRIDVDAAEQAAGAEWLQRIEDENAGELTPERLAKLEAESARADADGIDARAGPPRSTRTPHRPTAAASPGRSSGDPSPGWGGMPTPAPDNVGQMISRKTSIAGVALATAVLGTATAPGSAREHAAAKRITGAGVGQVKLGKTHSQLREQGLVGPLSPGCELAARTPQRHAQGAAPGLRHLLAHVAGPRRTSRSAAGRRHAGSASARRSRRSRRSSPRPRSSTPSRRSSG